MTTPFFSVSPSPSYPPDDNAFVAFVSAWNETRTLSTPAHHRQMATWLQERWDSSTQRHGVLLSFRNAGKSTLVGLFCAWMLTQDPGTRILVVAAEHGLARKMVRNVKRILERHPWTAHLLPSSRDQWAADALTVQRQAEWRDPSVLARGLGANVTGARADVIICDDVEVPNTCTTSMRRADLRARLYELDYVIVPGGMQVYLGTPHTAESIYAPKPVGSDPETSPFLEGFARLEVPLVDVEGQSAWPERFPQDAIDALRTRTGPNKFASQMQLVPVNVADGRFNPTLLTLYDGEIHVMHSNGETVLRLNEVRMVSATCCWDPAFGVGASRQRDGSVIAVVFCDAYGSYWLHRMAWITVPPSTLGGPHELNPTAGPALPDDVASWQCRFVARFVREMCVPAVRVESNGLGRFLPSLLRRVMVEEDVAAAVVEYTSHRSKAERILEALDAPLAAGRVYAHRSVMTTPFAAELRDWRPDQPGHDDGLDAVAACLSVEPVRLPRCFPQARAFGSGGPAFGVSGSEVPGFGGLRRPSPSSGQDVSWRGTALNWKATTDFTV